MTYPLLEKAPPHDTPEFLTYLRENNVVVWEDEDWLVIENCKYHSLKRIWLTAFAVRELRYSTHLILLISKFGHLEWKKKATDKQTVKRFHLHMYESIDSIPKT